MTLSGKTSPRIPLRRPCPSGSYRLAFSSRPQALPANFNNHWLLLVRTFQPHLLASFGVAEISQLRFASPDFDGRCICIDRCHSSPAHIHATWSVQHTALCKSNARRCSRGKHAELRPQSKRCKAVGRLKAPFCNKGLSQASKRSSVHHDGRTCLWEEFENFEKRLRNNGDARNMPVGLPGTPSKSRRVAQSDSRLDQVPFTKQRSMHTSLKLSQSASALHTRVLRCAQSLA